MSNVTIRFQGWGRAGWGEGPYGDANIPFITGEVGSVSVNVGTGVHINVTGVEANGYTSGGWGIGYFGRGGWGEAYTQVDIGNSITPSGVSATTELGTVTLEYDYIFDGETITVKGKGLKEAVREYKQQNPKKLRATVE